MTQDQKKKISDLVYKIHESAENMGYFSDPRFREEFVLQNDNAWHEFKTYLKEIGNETNA